MNLILRFIIFIYFQSNLYQVVYSVVCPYYPSFPSLNLIKNASCSDECCDKYASTESEACCSKILSTNIAFYLSIVIPVSCLLICIIGSVIYFWHLFTKRATQARNQITTSESNSTISTQATDAPPLYKDLFKTRTNRISSIAKTYPLDLSVQVVNEQHSPPPPYRHQINIENQN